MSGKNPNWSDTQTKTRGRVTQAIQALGLLPNCAEKISSGPPVNGFLIVRNLEMFLSRFAGIPYSRDDNDCFRFVCRWLAHNGLTDPRDIFYCSYSTPKEAIGAIKKAGLKCASQAFDACGIVQGKKPKIGDIVQLENTDIISFGIYCGGKSATISQSRGACYTDAKVIKCWRLPDEQ